MAETVLVVDDDATTRDVIVRYLEREGFEALQAEDGGRARAVIETAEPNLVILDLMLPGIDGLSVIRWIRSTGWMPVIMLTALGEETDRIVGLELGADDYLPKPCNPRELVARLRAVLRRASGAAMGEMAGQAAVRAGDVIVRPAERSAEWRGRRLDLTSTEFNVLEVFVRNAGQVMSKAELSERALGRPLERYDRSLDMHVSSLRRKLGTLADGRSPILTVRGVGYQLIAG